MEAYRIGEGNLLVPVGIDEVLNTVTQLLTNRTLVFFFGAGVSREYPSLLPLAREGEPISQVGSQEESSLPGLSQILVRMLLKETTLEPDAAAEVRRLALEVVLDFFSRTLGDEALEFYDVLRKSKHLRGVCSPNYRHYFLALLSDYCRHLVTVNFDTLVEDAFEARQVPLIVPETRDEREEKNIYRKALASQNGINYLYKLHGTLLQNEKLQNTNLLATVERVGIGLPQHKKQFLRSLARNFDLFFMGYSDNDIDVFPVVKGASSNRKLFWYSRSRPQLDSLNFLPIREFLLQREHYILVGDLSEILCEILNRMNIDCSPVLEKIGAPKFEGIRCRENYLVKVRRREIAEFVEYYERKFLPRPAYAILVLANIMVNLGFWHTGKRLLRSVADQLLADDFKIRFLYSSLRSEIYRNEGQYQASIKERKVAIEYLKETSYGENFLHKTLIYQTIKNGSEYVDLAKLRAAEVILRRRNGASQERSGRQGFILALRYLIAAFVWYEEAMLQTVISRNKMTHFAKNTLLSRLYSECADLFHFVVDGLVFLVATGAHVGGRPESISKISRVFIRILSRIAVFFYALALGAGDQESEWFFLMKAKLAEVIMHAERDDSAWKVAEKLIDDVENFFKWGRLGGSSRADEDRLLTFSGIAQGIRLYYLGDPQNAADFLRRTLDAYRKINHKGGILKAQLWLAICQGEMKEFTASSLV